MAVIRYTEYLDADPNAVYDPVRSQAANGLPEFEERHRYTLFANPDTGGATFRLRDDTNGDTFDLGFLSRTQAAILADFSGQAASVSLTGGALGDVLIGGDQDDILNGGDGDDILEGSFGADAIDGGAGVNTLSFEHAREGVEVLLADGSRGSGDAEGDSYLNIQNIRGSAFDDRIVGDTADNVIDGGAGGDQLDGYFGNDTVSYARSAAGVAVDFRPFDGSSQSVTALPSGGDAEGDRLSGFDNIIGSAFDDMLIGNSIDQNTGRPAPNILTGGAGNDVLEGMGGADTLNGGDGRDVASYEHASAGLTASLADPTGNTGDAAGDTYIGIEDLRGSALVDRLTGDAGNNVIAPGGIGRQQTGPIDRVDGGAGRDTISYDGYRSGVRINMQASGVLSNEEPQVIAGFVNIENARGSAFGDVITGDAKNNVIEGGAGGDILDGGDGRDTLSYRHSSAGVRAFLFRQESSPGTGGDAEGDALAGFENLLGSAFDDTLVGGTGRNRIEGGGGLDLIDGGDGFDFASYAGSTAGVSLDLQYAYQGGSGGDAQGDLLSRIEGLIGSRFADTLSGDENANVFLGGTGDTISGRDGDDRVMLAEASGAAIDGGRGTRDVLTVAGEVAAFASLTGVELAIVRAGGSLSLVGIDDGPTAIVSRGVVGQSVTVTGGGADERIAAGQFDILHGGSGDDTIVVSSRQQLVDGGAGDDTLRVQANAEIDLDASNFMNIETVVLGDGAVVRMAGVTTGVHALLHGAAGGGADFSGTAAGDLVAGGAGDDRIAGGEGADAMRGGAGSDTFVFRASDEIAGDRISGFVSGADRIDLSEIDADGDGSNGDTAFTFVGAGAFTGTANEVHLEASHGATLVQIDTNGDAAADLSFLVRGDAPVAGDFLL